MRATPICAIQMSAIPSNVYAVFVCSDILEAKNEQMQKDVRPAPLFSRSLGGFAGTVQPICTQSARAFPSRIFSRLPTVHAGGGEHWGELWLRTSVTDFYRRPGLSNESAL